MVSVIVVNWNGWRDTILCLQSLFRSRDVTYRVIVCDNGSTDESVDRIRAWAAAELDAFVPPEHPARARCVPPPTRPISFTLVDGAQSAPSRASVADAKLMLIPNGANLGFAGGNNAGIRLAFEALDSDYVWLLNNDTVVEPDSMRELVRVAQNDGGLSLASSRISLLSDPTTIWFEGGEYNPFWATASHVPLARFGRSSRRYLSGCSLLIGRRAWERIGALDDALFMYGEDIDYSIRAERAGLPLRIATESRVLHAVGASSGMRTPSAYRNFVSSSVRVSIRHHGRKYVIPTTLFHVTRMLTLLVVKRRDPRAMRGYLDGLIMGLRDSTASRGESAGGT